MFRKAGCEGFWRRVGRTQGSQLALCFSFGSLCSVHHAAVFPSTSTVFKDHDEDFFDVLVLARFCLLGLLSDLLLE